MIHRKLEKFTFRRGLWRVAEIPVPEIKKYSPAELCALLDLTQMIISDEAKVPQEFMVIANQEPLVQFLINCAKLADNITAAYEKVTEENIAPDSLYQIMRHLIPDELLEENIKNLDALLAKSSVEIGAIITNFFIAHQIPRGSVEQTKETISLLKKAYVATYSDIRSMLKQDKEMKKEADFSHEQLYALSITLDGLIKNTKELRKKNDNTYELAEYVKTGREPISLYFLKLKNIKKQIDLILDESKKNKRADNLNLLKVQLDEISELDISILSQKELDQLEGKSDYRERKGDEPEITGLPLSPSNLSLDKITTAFIEKNIKKIDELYRITLQITGIEFNHLSDFLRKIEDKKNLDQILGVCECLQHIKKQYNLSKKTVEQIDNILKKISTKSLLARAGLFLKHNWKSILVWTAIVACVGIASFFTLGAAGIVIAGVWGASGLVTTAASGAVAGVIVGAAATAASPSFLQRNWKKIAFGLAIVGMVVLSVFTFGGAALFAAIGAGLTLSGAAAAGTGLAAVTTGSAVVAAVLWKPFVRLVSWVKDKLTLGTGSHVKSASGNAQKLKKEDSKLAGEEKPAKDKDEKQAKDKDEKPAKKACEAYVENKGELKGDCDQPSELKMRRKNEQGSEQPIGDSSLLVFKSILESKTGQASKSIIDTLQESVQRSCQDINTIKNESKDLEEKGMALLERTDKGSTLYVENTNFHIQQIEIMIVKLQEILKNSSTLGQASEEINGAILRLNHQKEGFNSVLREEAAKKNNSPESGLQQLTL